MVSKNKIIIFIVLLNFCFYGNAQVNINNKENFLPLDSTIRHGSLSNGFTYFIKSLPGPQSIIQLQLYNKAGINQQDDDQLDVAHAVEHLAFKSTLNFPTGLRNSEELSAVGMGMHDFWAITSKKLTTYSFDAPPGNEMAINLGLLWFNDIFQGLQTTEENINSVRGEVYQEIILKQGDDLSDFLVKGELYGKLFPCEEDPSNYFSHNKTFSSEALRRYYKDWYRPDLMAISIVGKIDNPEEVERQIKKMFSTVPSPKDPRKLTDCNSSFYNSPPRFIALERQKDTSRMLQKNYVEIKLLYRDSLTNQNLHNMKGRKRIIMMQMLSALAKERFRELNEGNVLLNVWSRHLYDSRGLPPVWEITIEEESGKEEQAVKEAMYILHQIQKFGVSKGEWEQIINDQLQSLNSISLEKPGYWNHQITNYYSEGEAFPVNKNANLIQWLKHLQLKEFNIFLREFLMNEPEDIGLIVPAGNKALPHTEKEVRSWIEEAFKKPLEPYTLPETPTALLNSKEIQKLKITSYEDKGKGASGAREIVLENGLKVILKSFSPVSANESRINIHGFSLKGAKCFPKEYYYSAINAPSLVTSAGANGMSKYKINRFLSKTSVRHGGVIPYVGDRETGIQTDGDIGDLETMLQLIYMYFTKPNMDSLAFTNWKKQEYKAFQEPSYGLSGMDFRNARAVFSEGSAETSFLGRKSMNGTEKFKGVEATNLQLAYEVYKKLYGNSKDFTFIISGNFDEGSVLPLVQKYLGNLPNLATTFSCNSSRNTKDLPKGPRVVEIPSPEFYNNKNIMYGTTFIHKADNPYDWQEQLKVEALGGITNFKAWSLRFDKGYSLYSLGVKGQINDNLDQYQISSTFDCLPEEFPFVRKEFKEIIQEMKCGLIGDDEFKQGIQRMYILYNSKRANIPRVMNQKLYNHYRYGYPWLEPLDVENFVKSLTVEDIIEAANKYYQNENLFEFVMKD